MHSNYIGLPPDNSGKKVSVNPVWVVPVPNASVFSKEDLILGESSGTLMKVVGTNTLSSHIYAKYPTDIQEGSLFTVGENILVNGIVKTSVSAAQTPVYVNVTSLVSHDNPLHGQRVDAQGQAYIRYEEGSQILDGCGRAKGSVETTIGSYGFTTDTQWDEFVHHDFVGTGSTTTYDALDSSVKLVTGTANDASSRVVSHKYHMHPKGTGLFISELIKIGDTGKSNVTREWGYFDDSNGIKFKLIGTTLYVESKGTLTDGVVTTTVPQTEWNKDKLDGTGVSGVILDVSKINRYWIDIFRGVKIRVGIYGSQGQRIVAHEFNASNNVSTLNLASTSLPIQLKQYNTGISGSTSEMQLIEAVVQIESDGSPKKQTPYFETSSNVISNCTSSVWTPLVSIRPVTNSKHAIALIVSTSISAVITGNTGVDGRVKFEVFKNATLTGSNFGTPKSGSFFDIDKSATAMTGGRAISEHMVKGTANLDMNQFCSYLEENLLQNIDGTKNIYTLAVKAIAEPCDCIAAINWEEYQV